MFRPVLKGILSLFYLDFTALSSDSSDSSSSSSSDDSSSSDSSSDEEAPEVELEISRKTVDFFFTDFLWPFFGTMIYDS